MPVRGHRAVRTRISNFEFRISNLTSRSICPPPEATVVVTLLRWAGWQAGQSPTKAPAASSEPSVGMGGEAATLTPDPEKVTSTRNPTVVVTHGVNSTVDKFQSASKAIYHSYLSESRGGRTPDVAFRGRVGGGWGREIGVRGRRPARMQPAGAPKARSGRGRCDRRALALGGRGDLDRVAAGPARGRRADSGAGKTKETGRTFRRAPLLFLVEVSIPQALELRTGRDRHAGCKRTAADNRRSRPSPLPLAARRDWQQSLRWLR